MIGKTERVARVGSCALFAALPADARGVLAEAFDEEVFAPGEEVCARGEHAERLYLVHRGGLDVHLPDDPRPVRTLGPGDLLSEYGTIPRRRTTTVRAREATTLLSLDHDRFRAFLLRVPLALHGLFEESLRRLEAAERRH